jgi:hypothetical protein
MKPRCGLLAGKPDAYDAALTALREDTRRW